MPLIFYLDINECSQLPVPCNTIIGETCFNLDGGFNCKCNANQGLFLINGTCQGKPSDTHTVNFR